MGSPTGIVETERRKGGSRDGAKRLAKGNNVFDFNRVITDRRRRCGGDPKFGVLLSWKRISGRIGVTDLPMDTCAWRGGVSKQVRSQRVRVVTALTPDGVDNVSRKDPYLPTKRRGDRRWLVSGRRAGVGVGSTLLVIEEVCNGYQGPPF